MGCSGPDGRRIRAELEEIVEHLQSCTPEITHTGPRDLIGDADHPEDLDQLYCGKELPR